MKNWVTAIAAATLTSVVGIQAHSADYADELREWVIGPCTEVSAALDVGDLDKDSLDLGIKRTDIAQLMVASRDSAVQDLAGKMKAVATWEDRRAAYPVMLRLCLSQLPGMK